MTLLINGQETLDVTHLFPASVDLKEGPAPDHVRPLRPSCIFFAGDYHIVTRTSYGDCGDVMMRCVGCGGAIATSLPRGRTQ